jgi:phosphoglycolate phosphatase
MHIIFDLDGTLIDSKGEILNTYRLVFNEIPPAVYPDLDKLNYGLTLTDLLKSVYGADQENTKRAKTAFMSIYDASDYEHTNFYEGVAETLELLKSDGHTLHIATNKRLYPTNRILEIKNIKHLFGGIIANEMTPGITLTKQQMIAELKKQYSFSEGFMVGDSLTDIQAGIDEQLYTVAVNYGYEDANALAALKPSYSIDSFRNLYTFVAGAYPR